jgi:chitobiase/beta-hexosaminidase-like protein
VHSYGGYFMWPPGAYKTDGRVTLPYPSYGTLQYFDQTAASVLDRIKSYRGTAILPARTGPVADVLYSAAGNSADEAYYDHGIIGYDFEIGADRFTGTGTDQTEVGFTPPYNDEGHAEGMEFAHGNYALLGSALDYARDTKAPTVTAVGPDMSPSSFDVTFSQDEAAEIHYTTDGSTPTLDSPLYGPSHPRGRPEPVRIVGTTTLRWIARDFKGNTSTGSRGFVVGGDGGVGGDVPAVLSLTLGAAPSFGAFTPGVDRDYEAGTTATVTSTAGDALLSVADPDTAHPGHLVNGQYFLPSPLQMRGRKSDAQGTAFNNVNSLLNLLTWSAPVTNDAVNLDYKQHIGASDGLRTGNYSKTLTFTLSTTKP